MPRIHILAAALLLTACEAEPSPSATPEAIRKAASPSPVATPAAEARKIDESSDLVEFGYSWPAEASTHTALRGRLEAELAKDRTEATGLAEADRKERQEGDFPFHPHAFSKSWAVSGETPLLLALSAETYTFTGGAHGNTGYETLLWDKQQDRDVTRVIVLPQRLLEVVTPRYCDALDRAREQKRGEPVSKDPGGLFNDCPKLGDQALTPLDSDANSRFDTIDVLIGPYEAGPYAEGSYELELPIDAATLAAIPDAYRDQFEIKAAKGADQPQ